MYMPATVMSDILKNDTPIGTSYADVEKIIVKNAHWDLRDTFEDVGIAYLDDGSVASYWLTTPGHSIMEVYIGESLCFVNEVYYEFDENKALIDIGVRKNPKLP